MERGAQKLSGEMEVEVMEDDLLFAELSRQISLLITDDDEELRAVAQYPPSSPPVPYPGHVLNPVFDPDGIPDGGGRVKRKPAPYVWNQLSLVDVALSSKGK